MVSKIVILFCLTAGLSLTQGAVVPVAPVPVAAPVAVKVEDYDPNPQYSFSYDVQDALTGDSKTQFETRNGDVVQGSYSLIEADGTRRIVDYTADPINGFNAVVNREPAVAVAPVVTNTVVAEPAPVVAAAAPVVAPAIARTIAAAPVVARTPVARPIFARTAIAAPVAAPVYRAPIAAPVAAPVFARTVAAAPVSAPVFARTVAAAPVAAVQTTYGVPRAVATRLSAPVTYV